ncbi:MAG: lysophospholipid acyltransferase family protein [Bacteroidota bacterium]
MYTLLAPLRVLWKVYFFLVFSLTLILLYPVFYLFLSRQKWFPLAFQSMRFWGFLLRTIPGIALLVKRKAPLPPAPFVICSNHSSYIDIIMMYGVIPNYFVFMGKAEINSWPLFRIFFTRQMNISVERGSVSGAQQALDRAREDLDKGHNIAIFPEGTIPSDAPNMLRFKNGAFKLAIDKQVPIVPVTFLDNWKRLQTGAVLKSRGGPGRARAIVHPAVPTKGLGEKDLLALRQRVYEIIQAPLAEAYGSQ